jgi:hypothetical protein
MIEISQAYRQAELALASYATLAPGAIQAGSLEAVGMASAQAVRFSSEWEVVIQHVDTSYPGASATVFEEISTGKRFLSIRGTEPSPSDLIADTYILLGIPPILNPQALSLLSVVDRWRSDGTLPSTFTVSGHSLGGFLAAVVGGAFRSNVSEAFLFNAPGVGGLTGNVIDLLTAAVGLPIASIVDGLTSIRASAGIPIVAGLGAQLAQPIIVETEPGRDPLENHSIAPLTDALAVAALLSRFDSELVGEEIRVIVRSGEYVKRERLERAINSIAEILGVDAAQSISRDSLHDAIRALDSLIPLDGATPYRIKL